MNYFRKLESEKAVACVAWYTAGGPGVENIHTVLENYIIRQSKDDIWSSLAKLSVLRCAFGYYRYQINQRIGLLWCQHFLLGNIEELCFYIFYTHNIEFVLYNRRILLNQPTLRDKSFFLYFLNMSVLIYTELFHAQGKKCIMFLNVIKKECMCVCIYIWCV